MAINIQRDIESRADYGLGTLPDRHGRHPGLEHLLHTVEVSEALYLQYGVVPENLRTDRSLGKGAHQGCVKGF